MDVRNCRSCGRLFNYLSGPPICPSCKDKLEMKFLDVKEYLREKPNSSIQAVAEDNEVSTQQIHQWVREERLKFSDDSPIGLDCEGCGKTIKTGRYCEACKNKTKNELNSLLDKSKPVAQKAKTKKEREKMRFLDKQQP